MKIFEFDNVTKNYFINHDKITALNEVSFSIDSGELVAIMGRSGSGKSTLINIIAGLIRPDYGKVYFEGKSFDSLSNRELLHYRRTNIGLIVQNYALLETETVFDNVALPLKLRGISKSTINNIVNETLNRLEIFDKAQVPVYKLSGGQKQKTAIARAICYRPKIILADEPTAALDRVSEQEIMQWFIKLHADNITIILVTHDSDISAQCDKTILFDNGKIIEDN